MQSPDLTQDPSAPDLDLLVAIQCLLKVVNARLAAGQTKDLRHVRNGLERIETDVERILEVERRLAVTESLVPPETSEPAAPPASPSGQF